MHLEGITLDKYQVITNENCPSKGFVLIICVGCRISKIVTD